MGNVIKAIIKVKGKSLIRNVFDFKGSPAVALAVFVLFVLEKRYSLRKRKLALLKRLKTNLAIAAIAAVGLRLSLIPVLVHLAFITRQKQWGVLRRMPVNSFLNSVIAFLMLDYGNYRWHKLTHKIPFLWRFHQVHHADLDLDVSTALRFHLGEVLLSVLYRGSWVFFLGVTPKVVLVYEILFEAANNFHHSNLRLPEKVDKTLANFIVTPRMHGIHHSVVREETDSNYCIILTIWDRLHNTWRLDISQNNINIGIPYIRDHRGAKALLLLPFHKTSEWKFPNGKVPERKKLQAI